MPCLAQTTRDSLVPSLGRSPALLSLLHSSILTLVPRCWTASWQCARRIPSVETDSAWRSLSFNPQLEIERELMFRELILDNAYCSILAYAPQQDIVRELYGKPLLKVTQRSPLPRWRCLNTAQVIGIQLLQAAVAATFTLRHFERPSQTLHASNLRLLQAPSWKWAYWCSYD